MRDETGESPEAQMPFNGEHEATLSHQGREQGPIFKVVLRPLNSCHSTHAQHTKRQNKKEKKSDPSIFKTEGYLLSVGYRW